MKYTATYKTLLISAALAAAPFAFAQEGGQGRGGPGMPPPPPPQGGMGQAGMQTDVHIEIHGGPGMGSTTNPGRGWGDKRGERHGGMMGSSTEDRDHGTSTPAGPHGIGGFFAHIGAFFHMGGRNASSTQKQPPMRVDSDATTTMDASSTPPAPSRGFAGFFQHFFDFFH